MEASLAQVELLDGEVFGQLGHATEATLARPKAVLETPSDGFQPCDAMLERLLGVPLAVDFGRFVEG